MFCLYLGEEHMKEALKYLQAGAIVPVDMETTVLLVNALKEALAQPEQEPWCMKMNGCKTKCEDCPDEAASAQPEQEPMAYGMWDTMIGYGGRMMSVRLDKGQDGCTVPLYTTPPQRPEERNFCPRCGKRTADLTVIHTCTPPQEKNT